MAGKGVRFVLFGIEPVTKRAAALRPPALKPMRPAWVQNANQVNTRKVSLSAASAPRPSKFFEAPLKRV